MNKEYMAFGIGAILGSAVSFIFCRHRYNKITELELESIRRSFGVSEEEPAINATKNDEREKVTVETNPKKSYEDFVNNANRKNYSGENKELKKDTYYIFQISEDEFGDTGYDKTFWTWYMKDGVMVDDTDEVMFENEVQKTVGKNFEAYYDESDSNIIYIRNKREEVDIAIEFTHKAYSEEFPI